MYVADRRAGALSGGQQRRLDLALTLAFALLFRIRPGSRSSQWLADGDPAPGAEIATYLGRLAASSVFAVTMRA